MAIDSATNLYASLYTVNGTIKKYNAQGNGNLYATLNGSYYAYGIALDSATNLYVACIGSSSIWKVDPQGNGTVFASSSSGLSSTAFIAITGTVIAPFNFTGTKSSQGGIQLNWPSNYGFVLQQNNNLETTNWITVTNTPTITNALDQLILAPTNNQEFFRLVYP